MMMFDTISLDQLATFEMGQSPDSKFVVESDEGIPFLQGCAEFGTITPNFVVSCIRPKKICKPGDILISVRAPVGDLNKADREYCIGRGLATIRFKNGIDTNFGWHLLSYWATSLRVVAQGSTFEAIGKQALANLQIADIPLPEQRRIAEILDTIDEAIQKTEALISKLKAVKQGLLHDLPTRGLDENGKLRDPKAHPEQFKDSTLGRIPRIWATPTLDEITTAPICYGIVQVGPYANTGVPVLAIRDLHSNYVSNVHKTAPGIDKQYTRSRVASGDLLLSIKGTIGRIGVVPPFFVGNISRDLARIRVIRDVLPDYLRYMFESPFGQNRLLLTVVGTTRAELSIGRLKELCVLIPPLDEQKQITVILDSHSTRVRTEEQYRDKLKLQKKGLMHDLLTGKVRVRM